MKNLFLKSVFFVISFLQTASRAISHMLLQRPALGVSSKDEYQTLNSIATIEKRLHDSGGQTATKVLSTSPVTSVAEAKNDQVPMFVSETSIEPKVLDESFQDNFPVHLASEFAENAPTTAWYINGLIPVGGRVMMFGPPGCGKSFLVLELLHCLTTGRAFLGLDTKTAKVVYIPYEGLSGVPLRLKALKNKHGVLSDDFAIIPASQTLTEADAIDKLAAKVSDCQVICIDTFSASAELDENNNSEINKFLSKINRLDPERKKTIIMIHHPGHGESGRMRGGLSLAAAADVIIQVLPTGNAQNSTKQRSINVTKMKDAAEITPIHFELEPVAIETLYGMTTSCVIRKISSHQWPKGVGENMKIAVRSFVSLGDEGGIEESLLIEHAANLLVEAEGIAISAAKQRIKNSILALIGKEHMTQDKESKVIELKDYDGFLRIIDAEKSDAAAG